MDNTELLSELDWLTKKYRNGNIPQMVCAMTASTLSAIISQDDKIVTTEWRELVEQFTLRQMKRIQGKLSNE